MNTSWWKNFDDMEPDQKAFINLPPEGKHLLEGPPGSGKTNLLLLRAQFLAGNGEKNVLFLTYTKALTDFIRTGINKQKGLISQEQVRTFHSWAYEHILSCLKQRPAHSGTDFDEEKRAEFLILLKEANLKRPAQTMYSAIFVDEAQDLSTDELEQLLCLSDKICICGDIRQGIYGRNGLEIADRFGLERHMLQRHFRIGHKVARVADKLLPPDDGAESLEGSSNYNIREQGESSAKMHDCENRDEQFNKMVELIRIQLLAFNGDSIGIFCGRTETLSELRDRFNGTDLAGVVAVHKVDVDASFEAGRPIHVMTIHAAKGTEFRAVHIFGAEELKTFPMNDRRLGYTAITRAKTALNTYRTGATNKPLENAFAEPSHLEARDLF